MKKLTLVIFCSLVLSLFSFAHTRFEKTQKLPTFALLNGNWFDGNSFNKKTFYSVNGFLTNRKPKKIDREIDLKNNYILPPFGEAHNHNLDQPLGIDNQIRMYLREGVFYAKILSSVPLQTAKIEDKVNNPNSVDVAYSNGGLVATDGHAVELYEKFLGRGMFKEIAPNWTKADLDTNTHFIINNEEDLKSKWKLVLAGKPDFIKTFLEYSEEYELRKDDPKYYGKKGLNPEILRQIVQKAHKANLKVATHIETAADFRAAILAGADEIAHLPGYIIPKGADISIFQLTEKDAKLAAEKKVIVQTTTFLSNNLLRRNPEELKIVRENYVRNLKLLHKNKVKLAVGSDSYGTTSLAEAFNLRELNVFDDLSLLKYWCEITPKSIFPNRKIGKLKEGYEASFIALKGNPIEDFMNVRRIDFRFKQGKPLGFELTSEENLINLITTDGVQNAVRAYQNNPKEYAFTERALNTIGYQFLRQKETKDAIEIFKLIVEAYPKSANAYDSLAEAYMNDGNKELAIKNYKKSLELNPKNVGAKKNLKELEENN